MRLWTLILCFATPVATFGRTWTSHDRRYTIQANFVRLENGVVTLQTSDHQFRTVRLLQLSDADQELVRQLARALPHSVSVEVEGIGLSPDDALHDAFAKAIIQVVGAEIDAKTVVENDKIVQDRVLVFSDGFVKDYKDFGCRQQAGLFYRKILAYVQRRDLRSDAADSGEDHNAQRLYAEAYTKVQRHRIGMLLLQEALESFDANMLDVKLAGLGTPEVLSNNLDDVRITCRFNAQVRSERYDRVRQRVETVLEAIGSNQGSVEATHRRFPPEHDRHRETVTQLHKHFWRWGEQAVATLGDIYTLLNAKTTAILPSLPNTNSTEQPSTLFFIYVSPRAEGAPSTHIKSRWRWFLIDDQVQFCTQDIHVVVRYADSAGNKVLEERFPIGPGVPGLSVNDSPMNLRTIVISPFFLYHQADAYEIKDFPHAHQLTLERKTIVPLKTLAQVQTAKALALAKEVDQSTECVPSIEAFPNQRTRPTRGWASPVTEVKSALIGAFNVSATDLINRGQPSFSSAALVGGRLAAGSNLDRLNDGDLYGGCRPQESFFTFQCVDGVVLFKLNTTHSPLGYDITKIVSIAASGGGNQQRSRQHHTVEVATVGANTFVPLFSVQNLGSTSGEVEVTTVGEGNEPLARSVESIRLTFHLTDSPCTETMYREFDIFGVPTRD